MNAEGCPRSAFLCMPTEAQIRVPNFTRLVNDAVKLDEGISAGRSSGHSVQVKIDVAHFARQDLETFRVIAAGHKLTPVLIELAIFDDELLQIAIDPSERIMPAHVGALPDAVEFLSVSASYEEFGEDPSLLRAWHRASRLVVDMDKVSTVGEKRTYDYVYIFDHLDTQEIEGAAGMSHLLTDQPEPSSAFVVDDGATIMPPVRYSLGTKAIDRIKQQFRPASSYTAPLDDVSDPEPTEIVHNLMSYLAAAAYFEGSVKVQSLLPTIVLLVVPFTRPWLFPTEDPSKNKGEIPVSRPGGGVFMLLKVDSDLTSDVNMLRAELNKLSSALDYVVFQAAMLEAQQQRFMTRESDVSLFGHTINAQLREASTACSSAEITAKQSMSDGSELMKDISTAKLSVDRLRNVSEIARKAVLMRSGRAAPESFDCGVGLPEFAQLLAERFESAMRAARDSVKDPRILESVARATHIFAKPTEAAMRVRISSNYLELLINELIKNALLHGCFTHEQQIHLELSCTYDPKYVYLTVVNPIPHDDSALQKLSKMLSRRSLSLGITQIELLAKTYHVPLPSFNALKTYFFSVTCVVAEKLGPAPIDQDGAE